MGSVMNFKVEYIKDGSIWKATTDVFPSSLGIGKSKKEADESLGFWIRHQAQYMAKALGV